jgi:hypothetical protein
LAPWPEDQGSNAHDLEAAPSKSGTRLQKYHMLASENNLWNLQCCSLKKLILTGPLDLHIQIRLFLEEMCQSKTASRVSIHTLYRCKWVKQIEKLISFNGWNEPKKRTERETQKLT